MTFFDELGKKITQTGQEAVQKTKNVAEIVKLNGMISDEEKHINNYFLQIGKMYFENYGDNPEECFEQFIEGIKSSRVKIAAHAEQIRHIKGIVNCPKCGGEVDYNVPFCSSCGFKMDVQQSSQVTFCSNCGTKIEKSEEDEKIVINTSATVTENIQCPSCGIELISTDMFCSRCGHKIRD